MLRIIFKKSGILIDLNPIKILILTIVKINAVKPKPFPETENICKKINNHK